MFLLDDILLAPVNAVIWLTKQIKEAADREFSDEGALKQKLFDMELMLEMGQISDADFRRAESTILERLEMIVKAKEGSSA